MYVDDATVDEPDQLLSGAKDEPELQYVPELQPAKAALDISVVAANAATVVKIRDITHLSL